MRYTIHAASFNRLKTQLASAETLDGALRIAADGHPNTTIVDTIENVHYIVGFGRQAQRIPNKHA